VQLYGETHVGMTRHSNQDAFLNTVLSEDTALVVVCDGMGGAKAGNIASNLAVQIITDYVKKSYSKSMGSLAIENMLRSAIESANMEVFETALSNPDYSGMGTTVVAAFVREDKVYIAHVGDSRAYLADKNALTQITRDHSVVQSLIEQGCITPEMALSHPRKNVITRAVGTTDEVQCDFNEVSLKNGAVLICTDGLTGAIKTDEILKIITNNESEAVPRLLIEAANNNNSADNVTVALIVL